MNRTAYTGVCRQLIFFVKINWVCVLGVCGIRRRLAEQWEKKFDVVVVFGVDRLIHSIHSPIVDSCRLRLIGLPSVRQRVPFFSNFPTTSTYDHPFRWDTRHVVAHSGGIKEPTARRTLSLHCYYFKQLTRRRRRSE